LKNENVSLMKCDDPVVMNIQHERPRR